MSTDTIAARGKLAADLKAVIEDTEELLKATAGQAGEKIQSARARVEETLTTARARMKSVETAALDQAKDAAKATDQFVHENPWPSIGIAAGAGLMLGWLLGRK